MSKPALSLATVALAILLACAVASVLVQGAADAAFPGSNGKIFFESTRTGSYQIFSMGQLGASENNITRDRSLSQEDPAVSPSGLKIAYEYAREVWVMNVDGKDKRRVAANAGDDASPSWSPNGKKIAFSKNSADIWVVNADGTGQKRLTFTSGRQERDPAFSPDGTKIAYTVSPASGGTQVYVMGANGVEQKNLTPEQNVECPDGSSYSHDVVSRHASWSPNGRRIAFTGAGGCAADGSVTGGLNIWVMNPDGSGKRQLTNDENTQDEMPAYSPDGTKIAFVSDRDSNAAFPQEIYTMNAANGSGIRRLTTNVALDGNPDWQTRR